MRILLFREGFHLFLFAFFAFKLAFLRVLRFSLWPQWLGFAFAFLFYSSPCGSVVGVGFGCGAPLRPKPIVFQADIRKESLFRQPRANTGNANMGRRATVTRRQGSPLGFSLLELMITLAIIFALAAIALPRLVTARDRANEASAIISLRNIHTAETIYQNNYPAKGYSASLVNLGNNGSICETTSPTNACL